MAKRDSEWMAKTKVDWLSKLDSNTMNGLLSRLFLLLPLINRSRPPSFLKKLSIHGDSSISLRLRSREIFSRRRSVNRQRTFLPKKEEKYANSLSGNNPCFARFEGKIESL